jgi:uncharacterized protein (DUF1778 family)
MGVWECRYQVGITRASSELGMVQMPPLLPLQMSAATARLDLRLSTKDRERIDRAAALAGLPLAAFVRSAVLREADRTVAAESVATLSLAESKRFLAALGKPFAPNAALRRAMKRGNELGI